MPRSLASQSIAWPEQTRKDLNLIRAKLKILHPAFVTKPGKPERDFLDWYTKGYEVAMNRAASAKDFAGYYYALRAFTVGFNDEHLLLGLSSLQAMESRLPSRWPGFTLSVAPNHQLKVIRAGIQTDDSLPETGSELLSCDGLDVVKLLRTNVFPFYGNAELEKNWKLYGPRLLVDLGNPYVQMPSHCRFKMNYKVVTYDLHYRDIPFKELWAALHPNGNTSKLSSRSFGSNGFWFEVPTFSPDDEQAQIFRSIISELQRHRNEHVVIDLRGNTGGSSAWGTSILEGLYSKDFVSEIKWRETSKTRESYEYRVSAEAVNYFENLLGNLNKNVDPKNPFFTRVYRDMKDALDQHRDSIVIPLSNFEKHPKTKIKNPLKYPLIVVTDELCFSACLSFMDLARAIPGTIHVGKATSADSVFMQEINEIPFAKGDASLTVPILRVLHRRRGNNEPYLPQFEFKGDISDTSALEKFIQTVRAARF